MDDNSVPVVMDNVRCGEDVKDISDCRFVSMSHNCDHSEDIWLQCKGKKARVTVGSQLLNRVKVVVSLMGRCIVKVKFIMELEGSGEI